MAQQTRHGAAPQRERVVGAGHAAPAAAAAAAAAAALPVRVQATRHARVAPPLRTSRARCCNAFRLGSIWKRRKNGEFETPNSRGNVASSTRRSNVRKESSLQRWLGGAWAESRDGHTGRTWQHVITQSTHTHTHTRTHRLNRRLHFDS